MSELSLPEVKFKFRDAQRRQESWLAPLERRCLRSVLVTTSSTLEFLPPEADKTRDQEACRLPLSRQKISAFLLCKLL